MKACPICNAEYKHIQICHRCKTDLGAMLAIEDQADHLKEESIRQFHAGNYPLMFETIEHSCALKKTPDALKIRSCAVLLTGDFNRALKLHSNCQRRSEREKD